MEDVTMAAYVFDLVEFCHNESVLVYIEPMCLYVPGVTNGAETAYPSGTHEFIPDF